MLILRRSGCRKPLYATNEISPNRFRELRALGKQGRPHTRSFYRTPGIVTTPGESLSVATLPDLNPKTVLGHIRAGTWAARLRAMLPLGHARTSQLTGQQMKENDSPLRGDSATRHSRLVRDVLLEGVAMFVPMRFHSRHHPEENGFLFSSFFTDTGCRIGPAFIPPFLVGASFFSLLLFSFTLCISGDEQHV